MPISTLCLCAAGSHQRRHAPQLRQAPCQVPAQRVSLRQLRACLPVHAERRRAAAVARQLSQAFTPLLDLHARLAPRQHRAHLGARREYLMQRVHEQEQHLYQHSTGLPSICDQAAEQGHAETSEGQGTCSSSKCSSDCKPRRGARAHAPPTPWVPAPAGSSPPNCISSARRSFSASPSPGRGAGGPAASARACAALASASMLCAGRLPRGGAALGARRAGL